MTTQKSHQLRRTRVLQIFNSYLDYGGEEGSVHRIHDALDDRYHMGLFLTSSDELTGSFGKTLSAVAKVHWNRDVGRRLSELQAREKFDIWVIHNVFPTISPIAYELAFSAGIPVIQYVHNYRLSCVNGFFLNHGAPCTRCIGGNFFPAFATACWQDSHIKSGVMGNVLHRLRGLDVFQNVSHWIAISDAQKALHVQMGIPEDRISVIPHFYDVKSDGPDRNSGGDIMYIGRLSREKGVDVLLEAWKKLGPRQEKLRIVGDGPDRERLEQIVTTQGICGVEFRGFVPREEQIALWKQSLVTVVPSIWVEPFGMVVLEAWSRGVGVVVSDAGGLAEIVDEGVNGLKFPVGDSDVLAQCLDDALRSPDRHRMMATSGFEKLSRYYNFQRWFSEIETVLSKAYE